MPTASVLTCPLSGLSVTVTTTPELVTYEPVEDGDTLPARWGDVTIRELVRNPLWIEVEEDRADAREEFDDGFTAAKTDPNCPPEQLAEMAAANENLSELLAQRFPLVGEEYVWRVTTYAPLSPDALTAAREALQERGFEGEAGEDEAEE